PGAPARTRLRAAGLGRARRRVGHLLARRRRVRPRRRRRRRAGGDGAHARARAAGRARGGGAMTLVKICGLTREQDVDAAVAAGADMVGFVLVPDTPRHVELDRAQALAARVPDHVKTVAVVDATVKAPVLTNGVRPRTRGAFDLVQRYDTPAGFRDTILAV